MIQFLSQWFSRHPYTTTSLFFLVIVIFGWQALGWGERQLGFLLLLYFIITLGIRLDEISRAIGGSGSSSQPPRGEPASLSAQLQEIRSLLRQIKASLDKIPHRDDTEER
jgi:hypothetical protein